jgi:hypothetical protein
MNVKPTRNGPFGEPSPDDSGEPEALIAFAQNYFGADFSNPERVGCPSPLALRSLARSGELPDDELCAHLFGCSECFNEYRAALEAGRADAPAIAVSGWARWREQLSAAFSLKPVFAAGIIILITVSTAVWLAWRETGKPEAPSVARLEPESPGASPDKLSTTETSATSAPLPATTPPRTARRPSPEPIAQVRVKLAEHRALRDVAATGGGERKPIELPAARARLVIELPADSLKGSYLVGVADADVAHLVISKTRSLDGKSLIVTLNLRRLSKKASFLSVGRPGKAPYIYPVVIGNPKTTSKQ